MSARPDAPLRARVLERHDLSEHLVRLRVQRPTGWSSTGIPDEWLPLTAPGQFQTRYYTVRTLEADSIVLDVVRHARGLVTEWVQGDCVGSEVGLGPAKGSFTLPADAGWLVLVGDLTALPAIARITEATSGRLAPTSYVEAPAGTSTAYPDAPEATAWLEPPADAPSALAEVVERIEWPEGPGYFWMAGESSQMRRIRSHLRREVGFAVERFDVMGYWSPDRGARGARVARPLDPGPIYARGKAAGKSDEQIWDDYDRARDAAEGGEQ